MTMKASRQAGGRYLITVSAPEGSYDPGQRKFAFVIKSRNASGKIISVMDDGRAQKILIN